MIIAARSAFRWRAADGSRSICLVGVMFSIDTESALTGVVLLSPHGDWVRNGGAGARLADHKPTGGRPGHRTPHHGVEKIRMVLRRHPREHGKQEVKN